MIVGTTTEGVSFQRSLVDGAYADDWCATPNDAYSTQSLDNLACCGVGDLQASVTTLGQTDDGWVPEQTFVEGESVAMAVNLTNTCAHEVTIKTEDAGFDDHCATAVAVYDNDGVEVNGFETDCYASLFTIAAGTSGEYTRVALGDYASGDFGIEASVTFIGGSVSDDATFVVEEAQTD